MLILDAHDMDATLSMTEAIDASAEALRLIATGDCDIPLRGKVALPAPDEGTELFMYGAVPSARALGVKLYGEFPSNRSRGLPLASATVVLLDSRTGQVEALLEGAFLTQLRTGASSGVATGALASPDARVMALIGTGAQAWTQLEAVLAVRPIEEVRVFSLDPDDARRFIEDEEARLGKRGGARGARVPRMAVAPSADEAVRGADVVTCVTTSSEPVFHAASLKPGAHVNAVGSYTPAMSELPSDAVTKARAVWLDTDAALEESGDLVKPLEAGAWDRSNLAGLIGAALDGPRDGGGADGWTVYEAVGSAALDLVVGQRMVERARELGLGMEVAW